MDGQRLNDIALWNTGCYWSYGNTHLSFITSSSYRTPSKAEPSQRNKTMIDNESINQSWFFNVAKIAIAIATFTVSLSKKSRCSQYQMMVSGKDFSKATFRAGGEKCFFFQTGKTLHHPAEQVLRVTYVGCFLWTVNTLRRYTSARQAVLDLPTPEG